MAAGNWPRLAGTDLRRLIFEQSKRAGVGHIASALSIAAVVAVLFGAVLRGVGTRAPDRDRFVLSKGHAALAVYAALHRLGVISAQDLTTFCAGGSLLGVHPEHFLRGIVFSTGSLGFGLSFGAGAAVAARLRRSRARAFVLLSDAELNEGSTWEAVVFSAHHGLHNLVAIVDDNGQQALGRTADVLDLRPIADKRAAFGWSARVVDGHGWRAYQYDRLKDGSQAMLKLAEAKARGSDLVLPRYETAGKA